MTVRGKATSLQIVAVALPIGVPSPQLYFAGRLQPSGQEGSTLMGPSYPQLDATGTTEEAFSIRKVTA
jgi:hypothetical protein